MSRRADLVDPDVSPAPRVSPVSPLRPLAVAAARVLTVLAVLAATAVAVESGPTVGLAAGAEPVAGLAAALAQQADPRLNPWPRLPFPAAIANVAHRGASAYAPENTLAAFRMARARRADLFEIDVQRTRDGALVLMHDRTLARTTNVEQVYPSRSPWNVRDFTFAEIRRLDAGSWFGRGFRGERVPTLGQTLRYMEPAGLGLLLEVKSPELYPGIGRQVAMELRRFPGWSRPDPRQRRLMVQCFNWTFARDFKPLMPWVPVGLLGKPAVAQLSRLAGFADQINPSHGTLTADYVTRVHRLGMEIFTWTIDDPGGMRRAIGLRVDGIISNRPDVLRTVITNPGSTGSAGSAASTGSAATRGRARGATRAKTRPRGRSHGRTHTRTVRSHPRTRKPTSHRSRAHVRTHARKHTRSSRTHARARRGR